jgi:ribonucleoside-diphosphate reductase alpha chain
MENTQDELIKREIKNKLEPVKLTSEEKELINHFFQNNPSSLEAKNLKEKLTNKEQWKVRNSEFLVGANISVCISDRFMEAVKNDKE